MTKKKKTNLSIEEIISKLQQYWSGQGCAILQPFDMPVGAGTFHPATFFPALSPDPWKAAYVQPSRRPADSRFGNHPNRLQKYYQFQVVLKPAPDNIRELYLDSLKELGLDFSEHDVRYVEDDWKSPTLGAWGLGWEVWCDGMEISQFTYFQEVGGVPCKPVMGEITYGIERLAMHIQDCDDVYDLIWQQPSTQGDKKSQPLTYGDLHRTVEYMQSHYNLNSVEEHDEMLYERLTKSMAVCKSLLSAIKAISAKENIKDIYQFTTVYEALLECSHIFNMLDARQCFNAETRTAHIGEINRLACSIAKEAVKRSSKDRVEA